MIFPGKLRQGACVGLVAPASPVTWEERLKCEQRLCELGFSVTVGESLLRDENCYGYLAGGAKERSEDLNRMFQDDRVEAVFCTRGGYGSMELLPFLDYRCIGRNPKIFAGFSDITAMHTALWKYCSLVTFHGPMVRSNLLGQPDGYTLESFFAVCNMEKSVTFLNPLGEQLKILREGSAQGRLTGGNLSVLARALGTPYALAPREESILFLEDVGESIPRIHMYLTQMRYAGVFDKVRGILLGDFTDCTNEGYDERLTAVDFLKYWLKALNVPIIANVCSDHRRTMGTLPLGAFCRMDAERDGRAEITFFR